MSALIVCIFLLLLMTITLHSHRQKMNWPHLNPNKSFVHPQNVTGFDVFSGIWQSALLNSPDKHILWSAPGDTHWHNCAAKQTNASFTLPGPNWYFQSVVLIKAKFTLLFL